MTKAQQKRMDTMTENINNFVQSFNDKMNNKIRQTPGGIYYNDMPLYNGREIQYPHEQHTGITIVSRNDVLEFMGIKSPE